MDIATRTSELDAVNIILSAGGEQPIADLTSGASVNSKLAENILKECAKDILSAGWYFNTRHDVDLPVNAEQEIEVGDDIIRIDFEGFGNLTKYTIRNGKVYDSVSGTTDEFDENLTVKTIVYLLNWDDIPETFKLYITKKAARTYVQRHVQDPSLLRAAIADEQLAHVNIQREDIATSNPRVFGEFSRIVDRGKPLDWITF